MVERNLDFDRIINRKNTRCLKYDFAVKEESRRMCCLCGWQIWILRPLLMWKMRWWSGRKRAFSDIASADSLF